MPTHRRASPSKRPSAGRIALRIALLANGLALALSARNAFSAPFALGGGLAYESAPGGEITRSGYGLVAGGSGRTSAMLSLAGFNDSIVRTGLQITGGVGFEATPATTLRIWGARATARDDFVSWRVKTGPQWTVATGRSVGLYYAHWHNSITGTTNGLIGELGLTVRPDVAARFAGSLAGAPGGLTSMQGTTGIDWQAIGPLTLSAEVGLAVNGAPGSQYSPLGSSGRGSGSLIPGLGGGPLGPSEPARSTTEPTFTIGARVLLP